MGAVGDALDNALAESIIGLFKTELIRRRGPWRTVEHIEAARLHWVATGCSRSTETSHPSSWSRPTAVRPPVSTRPDSQEHESPEKPGRFILPLVRLGGGTVHTSKRTQAGAHYIGAAVRPIAAIAASCTSTK